MKTLTRNTLIGAVLSLTTATAHAIPVVNSGFETGDFTGWTLGGGTSSVFVEDITVGSPNAAHSGTYGVHLGTSAPGTLTQTLSTLSGTNYQIEFWLSNIGENGSGVIPNTFSVSFDGVTLFSQANMPVTPYSLFSFSGLASGGTADLVFTYSNSPDHFFLDDVAVIGPGPSAAPELDATSATLPLGLLVAQWLLLAGRRRRSSEVPI